MPERFPKLMRPAEAARALGRAERTLRLWAKQGRLTLYRDASGRRFFLADEVERLAPRPVCTDPENEESR